MASTIANLTTKADGSMEGVFATLRVNAPIAVLPNAHKTREDAPDFRVINKRTGFELGAGWNRTSPRSRLSSIAQFGRVTALSSSPTRPRT